jgi:hypothetical protein
MKKLLFFFSVLFVFFSFTGSKHPYHVGSVEINYNQKSKTFEITGRFFLDDLENGLNTKYGKSLHFNDPKFKAQLNESLNVNYVGYEEDHESVNIYLESEKTEVPKKVEAAVSFLYSLFDDQINIVHIIVNGERKSEKLTYPNRYLFQQF